MEIEVKLILKDKSNYDHAAQALAKSHIKDECYYDIFLDFQHRALQERGEVLRLRVPCDEAESFRSAHLSAGSQGSNATDFYDPGKVGAPVEARAEDGQTLSNGLFPTPAFLLHTSGKLAFKQRNTVEGGHQLSFVDNDPQVPSEVVEAVLRSVPKTLWATGVVPPSATSEGGLSDSNPFTPLSDYARKHPHGPDGSSDSPVAKILESLRNIARSFRPTQQLPSDELEINDSNKHYSQVRCASLVSQNVNSQRYLDASSMSKNEEEDHDAEEEALQLEVIGGFLTVRKVYKYTPISGLEKESRQVRLDASYLLPGRTVYELEVPKCDVSEEEMMAEVQRFLQKSSISFQGSNASKFLRYCRDLGASQVVEEDMDDIKLQISHQKGYEELLAKLDQLDRPVAPDERRASEKRLHVSNTETDPEENNGDDDISGRHRDAHGYLQEKYEDFFFDNADQTLRKAQTLLRLRRHLLRSEYVLVLKAHQVFKEGQQRSLSSKVTLSEDRASTFIENPTAFMCNNLEHIAVFRTVWDEFGVHDLRCTAHFETERLTVPWWGSRAQQSTYPKGWSKITPSSQGSQSQPIYTSTAYYLSQQQGCATGEMRPSVPPLLIHLDKTFYEIPMNSQMPRELASETPSRDMPCYEIYQLEVTNLVAPTEPRQVKEELASFLGKIGVEWAHGFRSKLEQYYALANTA